MALVSIVEIPGDTDTLAAAFDQVADRMDATEPGPYALAEAVLRTGEGLMLIHFWDSEADFRANWDNPVLATAAAEAGMPAVSAMTVTLHRAHRHHVDP